MFKTLDFSLETKEVSEHGEFEGYASTFGNVDRGGDVVEPGAFTESVKAFHQAGRVIPMLWQHDRREPIGFWKDLAEDTNGLFVKGQLVLEGDQTAQRAYGKLKARALGGMSIGYVIPPGGSIADPSRRNVTRLKRIDLREISLVTMPMNERAQVTGIKSILDGGNLPSLAEFEDFLRDAGGFSRSQAKVLAAHGLKHLSAQRDAGAAVDPASAFMQALLTKL